ncbi:hypothetical protein HCN44_010772 [Aphidius gifuensis]|uniref:Uncharacterized protein n=1 Tax=Aphidius gifuensis TaxID=684658 RepID=A0A834XTK7_APHGI|nr:hypothetical protein HCN44_010772 [Aphidius gifuensis]
MKYLSTSMSTQWNNLENFYSNIVEEFDKSIKNNKKNLTECLEEPKKQVVEKIISAWDQNNRCQNERKFKYEDYIITMMNSFKKSPMFQSCYDQKYSTQKSLKCIDEKTSIMDKEMMKKYEIIQKYLYDFNGILSTEINMCWNTFNSTIENLFINSKNKYIACVEKVNSVIDLINSNRYTNYTTFRNLFIFRDHLLNDMKKISIQKIQQFAAINDNSPAMKIFQNINSKEHTTCCLELSKQRVDIATKAALNQTNTCFEDQRTKLENILNETVESDNVKEVFSTCYQENPPLKVVLLCFDWNLLTQIEQVKTTHKNISDNIKKQNELLPSLLYHCLFNTMDNLNAFIVHGNSLEYIYEDQMKYLSTSMSNQWNNVKNFYSYIVEEFDELIENNKQKNITECIEEPKKQLAAKIISAWDENTRCRSEKKFNYDEFIITMIKTYKSSPLVQSCYDEKYSTQKLLKCIDEKTSIMDKEMMKKYEIIQKYLYDFNGILSTEINMCWNTLNSTIQNIFINSKNKFNACAKKISTPLVTLITPNQYMNYTTFRDLFIFRDNLLDNMKKISIKKIQQFAFINSNAQVINIFKNIDPKDNATCCLELLKQRVDIATKIAFNQTNTCFGNQTTKLENILDETIEGDNIKEEFFICYEKNLPLKVVLSCFDWNLSTDIEKVQIPHENISDYIEKKNELLSSLISDCLLNAMNSFNEFIIKSNKHFDNCIEKKKFIGNCVDDI